MRTKIFNIKKAFPILLSGGFLILLSACGTHNNGYADTDGIYISEKTTATDTITSNILSQRMVLMMNYLMKALYSQILKPILLPTPLMKTGIL
jgi:hypothetical protein